LQGILSVATSELAGGGACKLWPSHREGFCTDWSQAMLMFCCLYLLQGILSVATSDLLEVVPAGFGSSAFCLFFEINKTDTETCI
jgi:hypothetical protein